MECIICGKKGIKEKYPFREGHRCSKCANKPEKPPEYENDKNGNKNTNRS